MFRDKRTMFSTVLLPVILYPILFVGFSALMSRQTAAIEKEGASITICDSVQNSVSNLIISDLKTIEHFRYSDCNPQSQQMYKDKDIHAIVSVSDSLSSTGVQIYKVSIQFDKSTDRGKMLHEKVMASLRKSEKNILEKTLGEMRISTDILNILSVKEIDTSSAQKKMGMLIGGILPYLLIMMLISGAAMVAADIVAGEKERKTLETLLVSGAFRNELVLGKYLTVITFALLNVVLNIGSLFFSITYAMGKSGLETAGISIPMQGFGILLLALIPLATFFAALLLSISTYSRNIKESGSYLQPVMMIGMFAAMISMFPGFEINNGMALIPIVNIALFFKAVMINEYQLSHLFIIMGSTILLDVVAIWLSIRLFSSEAVLFRSEDDTSLKNVKKNKGNLFNPFNGMVYFVIALALLYYLGSYLQGKDLARGLIQTQVLIIALPPLLIIRAFKLKDKEILRLGKVRVAELILIPFIAIPAAVIVATITSLINQLYPFPPGYLEKLADLIKMDGTVIKALLLIAVTPGICEEIMFRGFLMRFFEGNGKKAAVIISALLFAVFHLDPYRLLPTFLLGILLGYLTIRSGNMINSMLSHTINNALAVLISTYATSKFIAPLLRDGESLQYWVFAPMLIIFIVALYMFHKITAPKDV